MTKDAFQRFRTTISAVACAVHQGGSEYYLHRYTDIYRYYLPDQERPFLELVCKHGTTAPTVAVFCDSGRTVRILLETFEVQCEHDLMTPAAPRMSLNAKPSVGILKVKLRTVREEGRGV